jgi:predicted esterase
VRRRVLTVAILACLSGLFQTASAQEDVADIRAKEYVLDDEGQLRYFLIAAEGKLAAPEDGFKLLLVMPGGDGSADFQPFVKRIYKHALSRDYLVLQLIAPQWTPEQKIVWPTERNPVAKMKTSTEKMIALAIADLGKRTTLDRRKRFVLAWSSGGPAAYAAALAEDSPITGSFIAMSVFKPRDLPPLRNGKGRTFHLLHSPDDRICPFRMAESARDELAAAGADVELVTYDGGHGWRGDVFGAIRNGIAQLESKTDK